MILFIYFSLWQNKRLARTLVFSFQLAQRQRDTSGLIICCQGRYSRVMNVARYSVQDLLKTGTSETNICTNIKMWSVRSEKVFRNKNSLSNHVALYHKQRNWKIPLVIASFAKTIVKLRWLFDCRSSLLLRVRQDFQSCFILPTPHQRLSWWCKHTGSLQIWPQGF